MTVHFSCTMCGRCCHDLRLPLSVDEAIRWLRNGGEVQLFSEAIPWPEEPPMENGLAQHKRRRSFAARSAQMPVRVIATLVASFDGPCPNLLPDMRCGVYETRPQVCRVYPAELNPFIELEPSNKLCPPEAWQAEEIIRDASGQWTDPDTVNAIKASHAADQRDTATKALLCQLLDHATTGLSNEGIVALSVPPAQLLEALEAAAAMSGDETPDVSWTFLSNRQATLDLLRSAGTDSAASHEREAGHVKYLGFFAGDVAA
ncbi:YkgJ family cysteine cluster protein [Luteibacter anthropi]|uniref:YkgJ family cysteine cluster protein n=1 Tax=Luteibacter anthropi TaxID=564369 RepID=UPI002032488B|nr:YkgJ family cysteine cluster protein [Luteibacter anthropi]URX61463.1 YkgJ family cysteine cluster protein [Luteibacter anthropi]